MLSLPSIFLSRLAEQHHGRSVVDPPAEITLGTAQSFTFYMGLQNQLRRGITCRRFVYLRPS
jgi:hypothetical protein